MFGFRSHRRDDESLDRAILEKLNFAVLIVGVIATIAQQQGKVVLTGFVRNASGNSSKKGIGNVWDTKPIVSLERSRSPCLMRLSVGCRGNVDS